MAKIKESSNMNHTYRQCYEQIAKIKNKEKKLPKYWKEKILKIFGALKTENNRIIVHPEKYKLYSEILDKIDTSMWKEQERLKYLHNN